MHRIIAIWLLTAIQIASADISWPGKSGPTLDGNARLADAEGLPTEWNEASGKNVAWKIPVAGIGHSTPVIGNGRVWFTSATEDGTKQYVYCVSADDGSVLHDKLLFENVDPEPLGNPVNSYASPTCVLTENAVYVHFGTYGTAKLAAETADVVWQRRDINCRHYRGPGSSPVLFEDLLILTFDGIDQQFLTALNVETGKTVWRTERTTDYGDIGPDGKPHREGDLRKAYSTPGVADVNGRPVVVSVGSRAAFGYDARTGEEIWTITHDDYNAAARPLMFKNMAIINTGSRNANLIAVRLEDSTKGDVSKSHVVWDRPKGNSRLCFPVMLHGKIFSLSDTGVVACINASNGQEVWTGRVGGNFVASPLIANDMLYVCDERGVTTILKAGGKFEIVARNELAEGGKASPTVAHGALFLRTSKHLYKIASNKE